MACNTGNCEYRTLSFARNIDLVMMGLPMSIVLTPKNFDAWFTEPYTECVISFVAVLKSTDKLVVVTVGDLLTTNPTIASERTDLQNTASSIYDWNNINYPYSYYMAARSSSRATTVELGNFAHYNPLHVTPTSGPVTSYNQVNAGFVYPSGVVVPYASVLPIYCTSPQLDPYLASWQNSYIYSFSSTQVPRFTEPPVFATTAEIDSITNFTDIMIPAYNQIKYNTCGVKIDSVNTSYTFSFSGVTGTFPFNHLISFSYINPACGDPITNKDKGATILASINGKWKIIGIVIGFNGATGYGSRIDYIADQLGIEAWDGSLKSFTNTVYVSSQFVTPNTQWKTKPGLSNIESFTENGVVYVQSGITTQTLS